MYTVQFFSFGIERTRIFKSLFLCRFPARSIFIYDRSFTCFLSDSDLICFESGFTIMPQFWGGNLSNDTYESGKAACDWPNRG